MTDNRQLLKVIEDGIDSLLPESADERWIIRMAGKGPEFLSADYLNQILAPCRDLVKRGGKRWRPLMMVLFCRLCGGKDTAIGLAPLAELLHSGSLIIDDIEDNSDFRRGAPAMHITYGMDTAINSGNFLYFLPAVLITEAELTPEIRIKLFEHYALEMRRLHIGQGLDIQWHRNPGFYPAREDYFQMCRFKTGGLSRFSAVFGALSAGAPADIVGQCGRIAENIGVAFQIFDDVKNLREGNPGKKRGDDIVERKKSLPVIIFREKAGDQAGRLQTLMNQAFELGIDSGNHAVEEAISLIDSSGALEASHQVALDLLSDSEKSLCTLFADSADRDGLLDMIRKFA